MRHRFGMVLVLFLGLIGCGQKESIPEEPTPELTTPQTERQEEKESEEHMTQTKLMVNVNGEAFEATWMENVAAEELKKALAEEEITVSLHDYAGFEKVGDLGRRLPTDNKQTTTKAGDIVLYNGNQIVIFYGSNSWSYTRLAKIDDLSGWEEALGSGNVTMLLSLKED